MHPFIRAASGLVIGLGLCAGQAFAVVLTPNAVGGGNIPSTAPVVDFYTWDGNWAPTLKLPASAANGSKITIHADATYSSNLVLDNTDIPMRTLTLDRGDTVTFTWKNDTDKVNRWLVSVPEYTGLHTVTVVPHLTNKLTRVSTTNKDRVESVVLPPTSAPGAILIVDSTSSWQPAKVDPANVLHPAPMPLGVHERFTFVRYAFIFHPSLQKWYLAE